MTGNIRIARILGIPIVVNLSWFLTLAFVTTMLALRYYPEVIPVSSRYHNDHFLHWVMAICSGLIFFASILLHELAHSVVARWQGIPVRNITLFVFGGVSQISGEARRPLHEFVMAVIGPLTSVALSAIFFALWYFSGHSDSKPLAVVLEWLFFMNLIVAIFNMAPGFPMDGGRVLRSLIWGVSGNLFRATRLATLVGRGLGYGLVIIGGLTFMHIVGFLDPWSGAWLIILGLFLEQSARQSWLQAKALNLLQQYSAEQIMTPELETAGSQESIRYLVNRGGKRFIFFVEDEQDKVVGILTEKEVEQTDSDRRLTATASDVMVPTASVPVAAPREDAASILQTMESASVWHVPVVDEGRVIGVVSKENLLRLMARGLLGRPGLVGQH